MTLANREVRLSGRTLLLIGLLFGTLLRVVQIATSIGSVDSYFWTRHVELVEKHGIFNVYAVSKVINHPPLALEVARWTGRIGKLAGLQFFDAFRVLQCLADIVTALALLRLSRRLWVAMAFFLSPAAIFVSAFHCNSDPLMTMFVVLAVVAMVEDHPIAAGVLIGLAVGIKIIALPALPLLLFACRGRKAQVQYAATAALIGAVIFLPAVMASGPVVIRNIFGYRGWKGGWGLPLIADLAGVPAGFVAPLGIAALVGLWSAEGWRMVRRGAMEPERLGRVTGLAYLLVLFFATGFLPHYLFWFLPFLALLYKRPVALALHALISLFLFALYTSWAGEWPWVYAPGGSRSPLVGMLGLVVWLAIGIAAGAAIRSLYGRRHSSSSSSAPALLYFLVLL